MSVTMKLDYQGQLRCSLVHEPSGTRIGTDAPTDNAGQGALFSPTDLVGAALLSCAITTMAIKAHKEGIPFSAARGTVVKEMTSEGPRRIARLRLAIELPAALAPQHRLRLEEIARTCPVALSLIETLEVAADFRYVEGLTLRHDPAA